MVGWCGNSEALINVTLFALNEDCHVNPAGATSTKLTIGHGITVTRYDDADCVNAVNTTEVSRDAIYNNECVDSARRFYLRGPRLMTAVAVFEDSSCSATPVALKFTQDFVCSADQDLAKRVCESDGATLYSKSSCTNDVSGLTSSLFGNDTPYIIMEEFEDGWCGQAGTVSVHTADGTCHPNTNDETSFTASLTAQGTATITTYADTYCGSILGSVDVTKQMLTSNMCVRNQNCIEYGNNGCSRRFSVGGFFASSSMKVVAIYEDNSCGGNPSQLIAKSQLSCNAQGAPTCMEFDVGPYVVHKDSDCTDDFDEFAAAKFGSTPYLIVEKYVDGTNCGQQDKVVAYMADSKCHFNISDGTSFQISRGVATSIIIAKYPTSSCNDFEADYVMVGSKYINQGVCFAGNMKIYADMTSLLAPPPGVGPPGGPPPPPVMDIDSMTREQIMFPEWLWEPVPRRVFESD